MKKTTQLLLIVFFSIGFSGTAGTSKREKKSENPSTSTYSLVVFDEILFYDGYAAVVDFPTPEGVIRHRNDLYATKLTEEQLASFGNTLTMNITVKAACDNYDRIGNVNLAFVPKGDLTYTPANVQRIEIGRFITPFMNKNIDPTEVPYTFSIDHVVKLLKDDAILADFDIWVELEIFGVPYAANVEVVGCGGRNDVFYGTLEFVSETEPVTPEVAQFLLPLSFKADFNNYTVGATDVLGETLKTLTFTLDYPVENAKFHLITSNHGANSGGEEYNRRWHYVYFNDVEVLSYRPGSLTCEPFRMYNTQANGIYGPTPRTPAQWQSFSNWCPGDVIPNRTINLGTLSAGTHTFIIHVPLAVFNGGQGNFPFSLYLQGDADEALGVSDFNQKSVSLYPNPVEDLVTIHSQENISEIVVYTVLGQEVHRTKEQTTFSLSRLQNGIYSVKILFENGQTAHHKLIKK